MTDARIVLDMEDRDVSLAEMREAALHRAAVWVRGHGLYPTGGPLVHVSHSDSTVTVTVPVAGTPTRPLDVLMRGTPA